MLYFYCPPPAASLDTLAREGLQGSADAPLHLYVQLAAAQRAAGESPILVVDAEQLGASPADAGPDRILVSTVPPSALLNAHPYHPPRPVTAAGGYVACPIEGDVALLVIFRRGVWDLPKGKRDPGESIEACARREVREEIGIQRLRLLRPLGTTQHGYVRDSRYEVKTTHWFLMRTPERQFTPERHEGIERVAWARWDVARRHLGYATLRRHMDRYTETVRQTLIPIHGGK